MQIEFEVSCFPFYSRHCRVITQFQKGKSAV